MHSYIKRYVGEWEMNCPAQGITYGFPLSCLKESMVGNLFPVLCFGVFVLNSCWFVCLFCCIFALFYVCLFVY
jgi:hypothetical protein